MMHPLRKFRKENGLTLMDLAAQIDCVASTISDWENYNKFPMLDKILRVQEATGGKITANDFVPPKNGAGKWS